jgi:moderate conductance mechanosensitive channel
MERRIAERLERSGGTRAIRTAEQYRTRRSAAEGHHRGAARRRRGGRLVDRDPGDRREVLGIALQPILAGAGLSSVVVGFGAQQLVRDVLAGIAMLVEDQYGVGDWIEVEGRSGRSSGSGCGRRRSATSTGSSGTCSTARCSGSATSPRTGAARRSTSRSRSTPTCRRRRPSSTRSPRAGGGPVWGDDIIGDPRDLGGPGLRPPRAVDPRRHADQAVRQLGHQPPAARAAAPRLHPRPGSGCRASCWPSAASGRAPARDPGDEVDDAAEAGRRGPPARARATGRHPLDEPPDVDLDHDHGDAYEDAPDRTTELRIERAGAPPRLTPPDGRHVRPPSTSRNLPV